MRDERFDGRYWSIMRLKARYAETYKGTTHFGDLMDEPIRGIARRSFVADARSVDC
jgi:hypothetical protein